MKKTLSAIAVALVALTGCTHQGEEPGASTAPSPSVTPAAESNPVAGPDMLAVTYKATAFYSDGTGAPASVIWNTETREFGDMIGEWEESVTSLNSYGYAQMLVSPGDSGVDMTCEIFVNGELVDSQSVEGSAESVKCDHTLP